jgi:hypothetical protein
MSGELFISGGNPKIVATRDEITRCAQWISQSINYLNQAKGELVWEPTVFGFDIPNPVAFIQRRLKLDDCLRQLQDLQYKLFLASESYFSYETQMAHHIENNYLATAKNFPWDLMTIPIPRMRYSGHPYAPYTAALAIIGLTLPPSPAATGAIRSAASLAPYTWSLPAWPYGAAYGQSPTRVTGLLAQLQSNLFFLGIRTKPVTETKLIETSKTQGAKSFTEKLSRLQQTYFNPRSAIRIDSFERSNGRDLVVYIPGTQSKEISGENVFNVGSNISAMTSTELAPSEVALRQSLDEMNIGENDQVILIGHSQGGIIASNIVMSGDYPVKGLISVGAPIAHQDLQIPVISIEHANDIVPALSGMTNPMSDNWVTVENTPDAETIVEAHSMNTYIETAELMDQSDDVGLNLVLDQMNFPKGEATSYKFKLIG